MPSRRRPAASPPPPTRHSPSAEADLPVGVPPVKLSWVVPSDKWFRRIIVGVLFCLSLWIMDRLTPDSYMEEWALIFAFVWFFFSRRVKGYRGFLSDNENERVLSLSIGCLSCGLLLTCFFTALFNALIERKFLSDLPYEWFLINFSTLFLFLVFQAWNTLKPNFKELLLSTQDSRLAAIASLQNPEVAAVTEPTYTSPAHKWKNLLETLGKCPPNGRLHHLVSLRRLHAVASAKNSSMLAMKATIDDEIRLLVSETLAESKGFQNDFFVKSGLFFEWAAQKLPELQHMDRSDIVLANTVFMIKKRLRSTQVKKFFSFKTLSPIHPHTRETSDEKQNLRAAAAIKALPIIQKHGMRISEALTDTEPALDVFKSPTRIEVIDMGGGKYVSMEGNGRVEALKRAFEDKSPEFDLMIEARLYIFEDEKSINEVRELVRKCRIAKGFKPHEC